MRPWTNRYRPPPEPVDREGERRVARTLQAGHPRRSNGQVRTTLPNLAADGARPLPGPIRTAVQITGWLHRRLLAVACSATEACGGPGGKIGSRQVKVPPAARETTARATDRERFPASRKHCGLDDMGKGPVKEGATKVSPVRQGLPLREDKKAVKEAAVLDGGGKVAGQFL